MFNQIGGLLLVVTIICDTQTVEKQKLKTKQNPDGRSNITINIKQESSGNGTKKKWKFEDYLKKFEPGTIWEQIDKQRKYNGLIVSNEEQSEIMLRAMDPTDELMALNIENGDPKVVLDQNGRRVDDHRHNLGWRPSKLYHGVQVDRFDLRYRLHELMKQAIYTTRNKMVIMQIYRNKYKKFALYKMGFLFNKADNAAKTFGTFSFRAYRGCLLARESTMYRHNIHDVMATNERQMHLWFNVEILADLIVERDALAKEIFKNYTKNRSAIFDAKFID